MRWVWMALRDYKMWLGMLIYMGCDMPLYAFSLFLPTIISELGYSSTKAQLLTVPPYAAAAILTILYVHFPPFLLFFSRGGGCLPTLPELITPLKRRLVASISDNLVVVGLGLLPTERSREAYAIFLSPS